MRAKQTFELLLPVPSSDISGKVIYTDLITEWNYGVYEGLKEEKIRSLRKERGLDEDREWNIWSDGCEDGEYAAP